MSEKTMKDIYNLYIYSADSNLKFQEVSIDELEKACKIFKNYVRNTNKYIALGIYQKGDDNIKSGSLDLVNNMDGKVKISNDRFKSELFKSNSFVNGNLIPRLKKLIEPNINILLECCYLYEDGDYKENPKIEDYRFTVEYDHCFDESYEDECFNRADFDFDSREDLKEYIEELASKANLYIDWFDEYRFYVYSI